MLDYAYGKKLPEKQVVRLLKKGSTVNLKGFQIGENKVEGTVKFDKQFNF